MSNVRRLRSLDGRLRSKIRSKETLNKRLNIEWRSFVKVKLKTNWAGVTCNAIVHVTKISTQIRKSRLKRNLPVTKLKFHKIALGCSRFELYTSPLHPMLHRIIGNIFPCVVWKKANVSSHSLSLEVYSTWMYWTEINNRPYSYSLEMQNQMAIK